jgi:hypothetical protein
MSPITIIGSGAATSRTKSQRPCPATAAMSSRQIRRSFGSWSSTRRGVKPRFTSPRRRLCSGSSMLIIDGIAGASGRELPLEQNSSGLFETRCTSSCSATPKSSRAGSHQTGACARSHAKLGSGSPAYQ